MQGSDLFEKALFTGAVAGLVAVVSTRAIERLGPNVGSVLATTPTTIIPTTYGLATVLVSDHHHSDEGSAQLRAALYVTAAGMIIDAGFLLQWRIWPSKLPQNWTRRKRLLVMLCISLGFWLIASAAVTAFVSSMAPSNISTFGLMCLLSLVVVGLGTSWADSDKKTGHSRVPSLSDEQREEQERNPTGAVSWRMLALRAAMASIANGTCVLLASLSGVVAGLASTFPAIFTTIMVALWISGREETSTQAIGPIILGSASVPVYAFTFAFLFPGKVGSAGLTCFLAWLVAVGVASLPAHWILRKLSDRKNRGEKFIHPDDF